MDMKAVTIEAFGGAEKLRLSHIPMPKPKDDEVLIKIHYTSVNPVDWKLREGYLKDRLPTEFPFIPGWDAAGTIHQIGKNVKDFKIGDEVYAYCKKDRVHEGTYAEYIALDARNVARKPKKLNFAEAAAFPLCALTAWQALFDLGKLEKGQTILIHAGSGGVGGLAIQFAKYKGAKVISTTGTTNLDYVKKIGADIVIDYRKENFVDRVKKEFPKGIDMVFDLIGGDTQRESAKILKKGGCLVSIVEPFDKADAEKIGIRSEYCFVRPNGQQLNEISKLIDLGKIKVPHIQEMKLSEAALAQEQSKDGHIKGKIVLKVT